MNVKRKNTATRVLTCAERKRLADFFMLLAHIDKRMAREGKKTRSREQKQRLSTKQKTRLNYEDRKARLKCGPCFLSSFLYLKISKKYNPQHASAHHDRHHCYAFNYGSISYQQSQSVYALR